MCIGCREMKSKRELIRIVKNKEGEISLDLTGKKQGRGAYLCKDNTCIEKVIKTRSLNRHFKAEVGVKIIASLKERMED